MMTRLVTIGDSMTQGFQSGAIVRTDWSWPQMMARSLDAAGFRAPDFRSHPGGPIVDLEYLVRSLGAHCGEKLDPFEIPGAIIEVMKFLSVLEDHWERGAGTKPQPTGPLHHNVAVWGFEVGDADTLSDAVCRRNMPRPRDQSWIQCQIPESPMYRTARRTLNPSQDIQLEDLTQLGVARRIAETEGPIETLVVILGANNALGTCTHLDLKWSQSADLHKLAHQRDATIWDPEHLGKLLDRLYSQILDLQGEELVKNVLVGTVPHVTIAPVIRGVTDTAPGRPEQDGDGFYEFYTHFWVWDDAFRAAPERYPRLSREDAKRIDGTIDDYNTLIQERATRNGWMLVDLCKMLDSLAFRRNRGKPTYRFPDPLVNALRKNDKTRFRVYEPAADATQRILLDTRYLNVRPEKADPKSFEAMQKKYCGGLFSLDGIHPTTIGYGLMAHEILTTVKAGGVPGADPSNLDWDAIVANDTLVTDPPRLLNNLQGLLGFLCSRGFLAQIVMRIAGYGSEPLVGE